jgi:hypothetical protein
MHIAAGMASLVTKDRLSGHFVLVMSGMALELPKLVTRSIGCCRLLLMATDLLVNGHAQKH